MTAEKKRVNDTRNLEEQLRALRQRHPELSHLSEAMTKALKDTGEHAAITDDRRAQQAKDRDGHK
jgi:hypothetical protein